MPVDADPIIAAKGFRLLTGPEYGDGETPVARYCGRPEPGERLYVAHWSTCPAAGTFRK